MLKLPSELYDALAIIALYLSIMYFTRLISYWRNPMTRESREGIFDTAFGILMIVAVIAGVYTVRNLYLNHLQKEQQEAIKMQNARIKQREEFAKPYGRDSGKQNPAQMQGLPKQ